MRQKSAAIVVLVMALGLVAFGAPGPTAPIPNNHVPEPGSLLVFGTGLLLSVKALWRKA